MQSVNRLPTRFLLAPSSRPPPPPLSTHSQIMSLKMTEQMAYEHLARYGPYHPDNLNRKVDLSLPKPVESPAPPALMPGMSNCNCCKFASRTVRRPALYERRGDGVAARIYVARRRWRGGDVDLYRRRVDGVETT